MIKIDGQIFMGAGEISMAKVGHLYMRLGEAIDILNGIQQPPSPVEPEDTYEQYMQDVEEGQAEVREIADEIYLALTGDKKIERKDN